MLEQTRGQSWGALGLVQSSLYTNPYVHVSHLSDCALGLKIDWARSGQWTQFEQSSKHVQLSTKNRKIIYNTYTPYNYPPLKVRGPLSAKSSGSVLSYPSGCNLGEAATAAYQTMLL